MELLPILGLMSGTSIDGIDCSILYTDGINFERTKFNTITPYSDYTVSLLKEALSNPLDFIKNQEFIATLTQLITSEHAKASLDLIRVFNKKIAFVGFHGQTIYHDPKNFYTLQIGNAKLLSNLLQLDVIYQFRKADMKARGQGAPIAPIYHKSIMKKLSIDLPAVIINLGGISNLTYWDGDNLIGFDTGPANNLIDNFVQEKFKLPFDFNGNLARIGKPNLKLVEDYCNTEYFKLTYPKSLDRLSLFDNNIYNKILMLQDNDALSTFCHITARCIQKAFLILPKIPKVTIITGGGQKNKFLVKLIKNYISGKVFTAQDVNLTGDFIESELIAFLAARYHFGLPSTFPSTTGAFKAIICGELIRFETK